MYNSNVFSFRYYVGLVISEDGPDIFLIKFMRNKRNIGFVFPSVEDVSRVYRTDVVAKLPRPQKLGSSTRLSSVVKFDMKFDGFHIE